MVRKFISELVGTCLLVIFGCGTAVAMNTYVKGIYGTDLVFTMVGIALAFGLVLTALAYTIGKVSGAHVNPAVSVAALIDGRITVLECVYYVVAQILGGILGALALTWVYGGTAALGANGYEAASALGAKIVTMPVALAVEIVLTFVFVLVVLSATKKESCTNGIVVGLGLTLVHLFGIPFTGTSVNPARSIGPALLTKGIALDQLWVFIVGPLVGGILAALFYRFVISPEEEATDVEKKVVKKVKKAE